MCVTSKQDWHSNKRTSFIASFVFEHYPLSSCNATLWLEGIKCWHNCMDAQKCTEPHLTPLTGSRPAGWKVQVKVTRSRMSPSTVSVDLTPLCRNGVRIFLLAQQGQTLCAIVSVGMHEKHKHLHACIFKSACACSMLLCFCLTANRSSSQKTHALVTGCLGTHRAALVNSLLSLCQK